MFNLNQRIRDWRNLLERNPSLGAGEIERMVQRLKHSLPRLVALGLSQEEAFQVACSRLGHGNPGALDTTAAEPRWKKPVLWAMAGALIVSHAAYLWSSMIFLVMGLIAKVAIGHFQGPALFGTGAQWIFPFFSLSLSMFTRHLERDSTTV